MWKVIASLAAILVAAMAILTTSQTQSLDLAANALPFVVDKTNRKVIERLSRAIQFKTISNESGEQDFSDEFERLHKFLATEFPLTYLHLQVEKINNLSLLFKWQGARTDLQPALLLAHQDVVPTASETTTHWTHPPFSGENDGDYIWGRGTLDDKASLMAILEATEHLLAQGFQPQRTFYLGFGHDEELGGTRGAARIADYFRQHQIRVAYTLDEGGLILAQGVVNKAKNPLALIGVAEKGYASLQLVSHALGGHSSMPPRETAISTMSYAIAALAHNPMPANLEYVKLTSLNGGDSFPFWQRMALSNAWLLGFLIENRLSQAPQTNAVIRTTTATTMISGGIKENVLPTQVKATVNIRMLPGDTLDSVVDYLNQVINDSNIQIEILSSNAASPLSDHQAPQFTHLAQTIVDVYSNPSLKVVPYLTMGGTDSKHFNDLSDQVYRFSFMHMEKGDTDRMHGVDERISIARYYDMVQFYIHLFAGE